MKNDIKKAIRDTIPVLSGYIVLGMGFGILMQTKGYGIWWTLAMSAFVYAGSMQYLAVDLLTGGASLISAAITTLMVNARHLFYGISMVDRYKGTGKKKPYLIFALTDETYSLVCSGNEDKSEEERHRYYFLVSLFDQIYWVCGSVIGALLGQVIPFSTEGIDFALTALFVTVFVEQWKSTKDHLPAIIGVMASVICLVVFGAGDFLIPAMVLITVLLSALKLVRREEKAK
ncbi:MAG: AzlC family ABC transporter permease [Clostridia bacterium]|nr:AzlC family ABC transporter permease [Clostridia bacterium]